MADLSALHPLRNSVTAFARLPRFRVTWTRFWTALVVIFLVALVLAPSLLAPHDPLALDVRSRLQPPSVQHPFGTDEGGRDLYSRVVHGARLSLGMALAIVLGAALIGTLWGTLAGYVGGRLDSAMMRVVELFLAFPYMILAMAIAAFLGRGITSAVIALTIVWWPSYARMVRGLILSLKQNLFVDAARALGASDGRIMLRHIMPHLSRDLNVRVTLDLGYAILALTGLSFLGLGAQNPTPEWGLLVANARMFVLAGWWYGVFPGLAIFLVVLLFSLLGDSFFDQQEPRRARR